MSPLEKKEFPENYRLFQKTLGGAYFHFLKYFANLRFARNFTNQGDFSSLKEEFE